MHVIHRYEPSENILPWCVFAAMTLAASSATFSGANEAHALAIGAGAGIITLSAAAGAVLCGHRPAKVYGWVAYHVRSRLGRGVTSERLRDRARSVCDGTNAIEQVILAREPGHWTEPWVVVLVMEELPGWEQVSEAAWAIAKAGPNVNVAYVIGSGEKIRASLPDDATVLCTA